MANWTPATADLMVEAAPELTGTSPVRLNLCLSIAAAQLDGETWGVNYQNAQLLLACHIITLLNRKGAGGMLTQEKAGDLAVQFQNVFKYPKYWDLSAYGQMFKQLYDANFINIMVTKPTVLPQTSDDRGVWGNMGWWT